MNQTSKRWFGPAISHVIAFLLVIRGFAVAQEPPREGLVVWLDASAADSLTLDETGRVVRWADRSGKGNDATADEAPSLIQNAIAGRAVVRFGGEKAAVMKLPVLRDARGPLTIFAVCRRTAEQASDRKWQRLFSITPAKAEDAKAHGVALVATPRGEAGEFGLTLFTVQKMEIDPAHAFLGSNGSGGQWLSADVAEVLVYAHEFPNAAGFEEAQTYLLRKWGAEMDRDVGGWTRVGPLNPAVKRVSEELPLIDQANRGDWKRFEPMWDDFNGTQLDENKWWDHNPGWYGRAPALFLPENVRVGDGELQLTLRHDPGVAEVRLYPDQKIAYGGYSAASVVSKSAITYGCFEVRARMMRVDACSSWWFSGSALDAQGRRWRNEVDVYELAAGTESAADRWGMSLHVFETSGDKTYWKSFGNWRAPFRWADDFHVFNLEWSPDYIRYYVDGTIVRTVHNTTWSTPLEMIFDCESMDWLPKPQDTDLPGTYRVDYVRAWTRDDWQPAPGLHPTPDPAKATKVTDYVREISRRRAAERATTHDR